MSKSYAWKALERRVARALGSRRRGQYGPDGRYASGSDGDDSGPFSWDTKRTTRYQLRKSWVEQARRNGKTEGRPWLLVISEHYDRRPLAVLDFETLVELAYAAGWIDERAQRYVRLSRAVDPGYPDAEAHVQGVEAMLEEKEL